MDETGMVPTPETPVGHPQEAGRSQPEAPSGASSPAPEREASSSPPDPFSDLRSTYEARLAAATRALEEQMRRAQELELKLFEAQISALPEAEREAALKAKQNEMALAAMQQRIAQERALFEQIAKELVIDRLSARYGVPREKLASFNDPYAMEQFAREYADLRKAVKLEQRSAEGRDRVESGGGAMPAYDPAKFRNTGNVAAALKAKRAAGLL